MRCTEHRASKIRKESIETANILNSCKLLVWHIQCYFKYSVQVHNGCITHTAIQKLYTKLFRWPHDSQFLELTYGEN